MQRPGPFDARRRCRRRDDFTQTPVLAGSYAFQATYSGDGTYNGSTGACEPLEVTKVDVGDRDGDPRRRPRDGDVGGGGDDGARPGDGDGPARLARADGDGDVRLVHQRHLREEPLTTSSPFALDAAGVVDATTFPQTPSVSGASRSRPPIRVTARTTGSTGACEPLTVTELASSTVTVIHDAAHATVTSVAAGTTVHDQATVTGQVGLPVPTGTVTFSWFTNGTCTAPAAATSDPFPLDAAGVADGTTFTQTPTVSGSFAFQATYSGDGTYAGSTGACEPFEVTTIASTTVTVIHDAAHATVTSVPAGTTVHDQATVTGRSVCPTPTGTVTFSWFTNGTCTAPAAATSDRVRRWTLAGVADGTTFPQTPGVRGAYAFQATYSGDGTYVGSTGAV